MAKRKIILGSLTSKCYYIQMGNRKVPLITGEYYHIYLRGVEKRDIVLDDDDISRFLLSLEVFNSIQPIGSIYENSFKRNKRCQQLNQLGSETSKLVELIAFNILDNHYHLILKQRVDGGISKFMQSFNGGYTKYFNNKNKRIGSLFQGVFNSRYIADDFQLRYLSAYVNLNHVVHSLGSETSKWGRRSSWEQYVENKKASAIISCDTDMLISLYSNKEALKEDGEEVAEAIALERVKNKTLEEENALNESLGSETSKCFQVTSE